MSRSLTQKRRKEILQKANELVNKAVPVSQVLKRCNLKYRQLLKLSRDPRWKPALIFQQGYKTSPYWMPNSYTQLLREFCLRQYLKGDMTIQQLAWLFGRSERSIYRYISKEKHTEK